MGAASSGSRSSMRAPRRWNGSWVVIREWRPASSPTTSIQRGASPAARCPDNLAAPRRAKTPHAAAARRRASTLSASGFQARSIRPDGIVMEGAQSCVTGHFDRLSRRRSRCLSRTRRRRSGPSPPGGTDQTSATSPRRSGVSSTNSDSSTSTVCTAGW